MANLYPRIEVPLTLSLTEYADGDVIGGLLTMTELDLVRGAILNKIVLVDDDDEKKALDLYLFNAAPTTFSDNAAFAPTAADLKKVVTKVSFATADYTTEGSAAIAVKTDINDVIPSGVGTLYGYLVANGAAVTYSAVTDLWLALDFLPEPRGR